MGYSKQNELKNVESGKAVDGGGGGSVVDWPDVSNAR